MSFSPLLCMAAIGFQQAAGSGEIAPVTTSGAQNGISYEATAEHVPLKSDTGEVECRMFAVTYAKKGADISTRPLTFAFNGGPGSSTVWLHMGGLGPRMAPMKDDGSMAKPPFSAVPNPDSWLDFTDIVFVDAPACGFSRLTKPEYGSKYFGLRPDIRAFTAFVRTYLTQHSRWNSPLFIAGESYGGIRGSGLSDSLFQAGIAVNGFISISGTSNFATLDGQRGNESPYLGFLPSLAATAWYHNKNRGKFKTVEDAVEAAEKFVEDDYSRVLLKGSSLSEQEKDRAAGRLADLTGLSKKYILGSNLRVSEFRFFGELLREESKQIGRLDARLVGNVEDQVGSSGDDPSSEAMTPPFVSAFQSYVQKDLGVKTDMQYFLFGNVSPWRYPEGSYAETASDLRNVLTRNPYFHVLYVCGYYDLACPFYATKMTVNSMNLDKDAMARVSYAYYKSGHMVYIEKESRKKLHDDVKKFVEASLASAG